MLSLSSLIQRPPTENTAILTENWSIEAQYQRWSLSFPFSQFIWYRPTAIIATHTDGHQETIPIVDVTRLTILTFITGAGLIMLLATTFRFITAITASKKPSPSSS